MEVAARGGGHGIASRIVPHVSGLDTYGLLVRRLLTGAAPPVRSAWRAATLEFFNFDPGRVLSVEGLEQVRSERLTAALDVPLRPGDEIRPAGDDRSRPGYFVVLGNTRDDVDAKAARVRDLVRVVYDA
jgi:hypothetical protein